MRAIDKGLELADEMRRGLLKVALADSVRAFSSEKSDPDILGVCIPANILDQTQLEKLQDHVHQEWHYRTP